MEEEGRGEANMEEEGRGEANMEEEGRGEANMEEEGRGEANMAKKMVGKGGESEHGSTCGKFYIVFLPPTNLPSSLLRFICQIRRLLINLTLRQHSLNTYET